MFSKLMLVGLVLNCLPVLLAQLERFTGASEPPLWVMLLAGLLWCLGLLLVIVGAAGELWTIVRLILK